MTCIHPQAEELNKIIKNSNESMFFIYLLYGFTSTEQCE